MICDDVCYLIEETPGAHGVFDEHSEAGRMVFCQVLSVTRLEYYRALDHGLEPRFVLRLSEYADYNDEKLLRFRGRLYRVLRTYVSAHAVELTIGEATVDA